MITRTAVITGAAGGLGQATARRLLAGGFDIVAVTRDAPSAVATRQTLAAEARGRTVHALHADLVDRDAVQALVAQLRATVGHVDVLVNNAGAAFAGYVETADGIERTHALNHMAPFHLTHLLLDDGLFAADARIINISSDLVTRGRLDPSEPDVAGISWRNRFSQLTVYGTAKLANLLATTALADRLPAGMNAYSANPGVIRTAFNTKAGGLLKFVSSVSGIMAQAPDKAARTPVSLATAGTPPTPNGGYFTKGAAAIPPTTTHDADLATTVYERTARALGLNARPTAASRHSPPYDQ
ncbi:SDR family NAD(P)-dependent oxidoreductase [Micromonospora sp. NBC_01796]|uniref:SDR family NAD(P)-dependent oxidoreductase n=1 Tax=Micromonospora sp. NBC_01796 TaxID=2975987 RepID=UPI002DD90632|nr:SDR family NAD(P)-dependent oxidoreductase [Micromonospora sp. NBC_01796]WSA83958.1 SDR family NAD(P)-dependent oxidoreductase [Micromonospora sp. NBC_01796]